MEFRLLGPPEARVRGDRVELGPRQQRLLLAILALEVNRLVPVDRLVELIWPANPPRTAGHAVQVFVSRLRTILAQAGDEPAVELVGRGSGYCLRADPLCIDVHRFRQLVARAGALDWPRARLAVLDEALALWAGPPLAGTATPEVRDRLCRGLDEARLLAIEDRLDARLRLAAHRELLDELTGLVAANPLRERLVAQLMLTLHRCGRTGEALEVYRRTRQRLADEMGLDPSIKLRDLELAILRRDPALDPEVPGSAQVAADAGIAADPGGAGSEAVGAGGAPVPAQLPPAVAGFTGRADPLGRLDAILHRASSTVCIAAIVGVAGVGKTALAVQWAHRVRDRFPDGQLYLDLRGHAHGPPVPPLHALAQFLRALGVPGDEVPVDVDEATARYRTILADRQVLVLLDNAAGPDQVRPLIPSGPGSVVVVTSRSRLTGLTARDGAIQLILDVLSADEAYDALSLVLGDDRLDTDPAAAAHLARLCGYLPLALRIAAANLAEQPDVAIVDYAAELDGANRLSALAVDGDDKSAVRAAFDLSYSALKPELQRLWRLLALFPGPSFDAYGAAALAETGYRRAAHGLRQLAATHLVETAGQNRYRLHDLLRLYAAERVEADDQPAGQAVAVGRLCDFYRCTTDTAARLLPLHVLRLPVAAAVVPEAPRLHDYTEALNWLNAERLNLVAIVHLASTEGPRPAAWLLADTLRGYFYLHGHLSDLLAIGADALAAADAEHDTHGQAAAHLCMATAHYSAGRVETAVVHFEAALALARESGWPDCAAATLSNLGAAHAGLGQLRQAAVYCREAVDAQRRSSNQPALVNALNNLGAIERERGQLAAAAAAHEEALSLRGALSGDARATTVLNLGEVSWSRGRLEDALRQFGEAVVLSRENGNREREMLALCLCGAVHRDAGRLDLAQALGEEALTLVRDGDPQGEAEARYQLGRTYERLAPQQAVRQQVQALSLARRIGATGLVARTLTGLAAAQLELGHSDDAERAAAEGLTVARDNSLRAPEGDASHTLAAVRLARGDPDRAADHAQVALAIHREIGQRLAEARTLYLLGLAQRQLGDGTAAVSRWRDALALFEEIGAPEAADLRALLART